MKHSLTYTGQISEELGLLKDELQGREYSSTSNHGEVSTIPPRPYSMDGISHGRVRSYTESASGVAHRTRRRKQSVVIMETFTPVPGDMESSSSVTSEPESPGIGCIKVIYTDAAAGLLTFLMSTVVFVSAGNTMFGAVDREYAYIGIGMCVLPAATVGWIMPLISGVPWTIPSIDVTFLPVLAEMGSFIQNLPDSRNHVVAVLPTFAAAICIMFVVVGLALALIGVARISFLTNYLPVQVVAGFLAGTGVQLVDKAVKMAGGIHSLAEFQHNTLVLTLPAAALFLCFRLVRFLSPRLGPAALTVPLLLVVSTALFHLLWAWQGLGFEDAKAAGWLFDWTDAVVASTPRFWTVAAFGGAKAWTESVDWAVVANCHPYMLTAVILGVLKLSIKASAFSTIFERDIHADVELIKLGCISVACAFTGCCALHWSFANTNLASELCASNTGGGLVAAACFVVLWFTGIGPLQQVPIFVYAALLADVGYAFIEGHLVRPLRVYEPMDSAILLTVVATFVGLGMLKGIAIGVLLSIMLLVVRLHQSGTVRLEASGSDVRSSYERDRHSEQVLHAFGASTHIVRLQGYLFFTEGADIVASVERRLFVSESSSSSLSSASSSSSSSSSGHLVDLLCVILDLSLVTGMDITAVKHLEKLRAMAQGRGALGRRLPSGEPHQFQVILCGVRPTVAKVITPHCRGGGSGFLFHETIDDALEAAEDQCIAHFRFKFDLASESPETTDDDGDHGRARSNPLEPTHLWQRFLSQFYHEQGVSSEGDEWLPGDNALTMDSPPATPPSISPALTPVPDSLLPPDIAATSLQLDGVLPADQRAAVGKALDGVLRTGMGQASAHGESSAAFRVETLRQLRPHLEVIGLHLTVKHLQPGQVIVRHGQVADAMYFIVRGEVNLYSRRARDDATGQHHASVPIGSVNRVRKLGKGCIVGASNFYMTKGTSNMTVATGTEAVVLKLGYREIRELEVKSPRAAMGLFKLIGYFLARKNLQSKRQIQQLQNLYA